MREEGRKTTRTPTKPERIVYWCFLDRLHIFTFAQLGYSHPFRGLGHIGLRGTAQQPHVKLAGGKL